MLGTTITCGPAPSCHSAGPKVGTGDDRVFLEAIPTLGWTTVTQLKMKGTANHINGSCLRLFRPYNKLPQTGWLNNKHLFLSVLEAGKSRIKLPADLVSDENLFPIP